MKKRSPNKQKASATPGEGQGKAVGGPRTEKPRSSSKTNWRGLFAIDARSLAVFRMALGVLLLVDLAFRAGDLTAMYTDDGMFSRAEICRRATSVWNWSFHFGSGSAGYQVMLFSVAAGLAVALLIGCETRLVTVASWLMLVSLHHRVPPVLSGAEILLRMLLFWGMFLPLGRTWSLDRWREKRRGLPADSSPVASIASAAILLQMAMVYLFTALAKSNEQWFRGEALAGILAHDFFARPPAAYLLEFPRLLKGLTWGTLLLEWAAPLLMFLPRATARLRLWMVPALAAMHLGISLCLDVGLFSYVSMAGLILFLPAEFWKSRLLSRFSRAGELPPAVEKQVARKRTRFHYATQGFCLFALLYVFAVNINSFPSRPLAPLAPQTWRPLARGLGLSQGWIMFGSIPSMDGWYVARAKLNDGSEVDLLRQGRAVDWKKPECHARQYPNYFWHKLFREMAYDDEQGFQLLRMPVAQHLCRRWNSRHVPEKQIAEFEFVFCMEDEAGGTRAPRIYREPLVQLDLTL